MRHSLPFVLALPVVLLACGEAITNGGDARTIELSLTGVAPLDPVADGTYEAWVIESNGVISTAGRFVVTAEPTTVTLSTVVGEPSDFMITVEPPGDMDDRPSNHKLIGGRFIDRVAMLNVTGYVTVVGVPLEEIPGFFVLATPSDDDLMGFPSREDAGLWLFNPDVDTLNAKYYADFSPLTEGWRYEGWIVRDYGSANAAWISYGKFSPDAFRQANLRDDTGLGVFSGRRDYEFALGLTLHVPGDDWLSDSLGIASLPFPLPLDLNGDSSQGMPSEWTHVITIEPWGSHREAELPTAARPFFLEPYRSDIGEAAAGEPRQIEYRASTLPTGTATLLTN